MSSNRGSGRNRASLHDLLSAGSRQQNQPEGERESTEETGDDDDMDYNPSSGEESGGGIEELEDDSEYHGTVKSTISCCL